MILRIPISQFGSKDRLVWHYTTHGQYTVDSGYQLATRIQTERNRAAGTSEPSCAETRKWNILWQLRIKAKIKMFLWKCNHGALSVKAELKRRKMPVDPICLFCGEQDETLEHLFFHCSRAQRIWAIAPVTWDGIQGQSRNFKDWWDAISKVQYQAEGQHRLQLTAYLLWHIWKSRNEFYFNSNYIAELKVIQGAISEWQEYLQVKEDRRHQ